MSTIKLTTPIQEGKIKEITLRAPKLKDLRKHGLPFDKDGQIDFDKAGPLLESLSGVPLPFLDDLEMKDSLLLIAELATFIGDDSGN